MTRKLRVLSRRWVFVMFRNAKHHFVSPAWWTPGARSKRCRTKVNCKHNLCLTNWQWKYFGLKSPIINFLYCHVNSQPQRHSHDYCFITFVTIGFISRWLDRVCLRIRSGSPLLVFICLYKHCFALLANELHFLRKAVRLLFRGLDQKKLSRADRCDADNTCKGISFSLIPTWLAIPSLFCFFSVLSLSRPPTHHPAHTCGFLYPAPLLPLLSLPPASFSPSPHTHTHTHLPLFSVYHWSLAFSSRTTTSP